MSGIVIGRVYQSKPLRSYNAPDVEVTLNNIIGSIADISYTNPNASFQSGFVYKPGIGGTVTPSERTAREIPKPVYPTSPVPYTSGVSFKPKPSPAAPVTPFVPTAPITPFVPTAPVTPFVPTAPVTPSVPTVPISPVTRPPVTSEIPTSPRRSEKDPFVIQRIVLPGEATSIPKMKSRVFVAPDAPLNLSKFTKVQSQALDKIDELYVTDFKPKTPTRKGRG